jgi:hypothetical protein
LALDRELAMGTAFTASSVEAGGCNEEKFPVSIADGAKLYSVGTGLV